ncbi:RNA polymerase III subunit GL b [Periophthalmus magnuspinnatus]|uniref:RNA polymerase III subunit GL b n=1 Tax=Periophthalmus magnuspinnatus TaxID=409849 RepID=UPI00145ADDAE|nr:RNA polymerase III subunit GL b [Periophthalmus magnuspinnatus]XP_033836681.1 RNA polymerase III subunit GL b [Periophthalmus magnuspinnatus]
MMAGRGRGRGFRANFSLDSDQPTPLYPVLEQKPLPLSGGEQVEYLLALKQEFRGASRNLPSFLQTKVQRRDVERYSDKYHSPDQDQDQDWTPDWSRFPKELRVRSQKLRPSGLKVKSESQSEAPKKPSKTQDKDVLQKLESLEQKETHSDEEEEEEEEKKGEEEEGEEEQIEEDEFEEETDYIMSYFDNGEEFGADSDDNMDEAIY